MTEKSSSLTLSLTVLCIAVVAALFTLPSFSSKSTEETRKSGEGPRRREREKRDVTSEAMVLKLQSRYRDLLEKVDTLEKRIELLRSDHEALASWTLQNLLAGQSSTISPPPKPKQLSEAIATERRRSRDMGSTWADRELDSFIEKLDLYPQQVDSVRPLVKEALEQTRIVLKRLRMEGALSSESLAEGKERIREQLRDDLNGILTAEQLNRFDQLYSRRNRYKKETDRSVEKYGRGNPAPAPLPEPEPVPEPMEEP